MLAHLRPAILMLAIMTLLTGVAYPFAMTGLGQLLLPGAANGSLALKDNAVIGSTLIGQAWTSDKYFWGRPSAAGDGYNAAASSGRTWGQPPRSSWTGSRPTPTDCAGPHQRRCCQPMP